MTPCVVLVERIMREPQINLDEGVLLRGFQTACVIFLSQRTPQRPDGSSTCRRKF